MKLRPLAWAALAIFAGCSVRSPQDAAPKPPTAPVRTVPAALKPGLVLHGSFSDGTPLALEALRGRPWVVNLWLPG